MRENRALPPDLSRHARTLVEQFRLDDGVHQLRVRPESPLVGQPRAGLDLGGRAGLTLLTLQEAAGSGAARLGPIEAGDLMAVRGEAEAVAELAAELVLSPADAEGVRFEAGLFTTASGLAEVIIPPRSPLIGERLFPGMVTPSGNLVVLAIHRQGHDLAAGRAARQGRHAAAAGDLGRARDLHRAARGAGGRQPRARPPPGGAHGPRGADRARRSWR